MHFEIPPTTSTLPKTTASYLSKYQRESFMFLYLLFERQQGGLIADAIGLMKQLQSIAFLGTVYSICDYENLPREFDVRVLVLSPTPVRQNRNRSFETWFPILWRCMIFKFRHKSYGIYATENAMSLSPANVILLIKPTFSKTRSQSTIITTTTKTTKTSFQGKKENVDLECCYHWWNQCHEE